MGDTGTLLIIGGGLSGLSAGCYGRMNGFDTRILEHAAETGGVCTTWSRSPYLVDGCIQWLIGSGPAGSFRRVYDELGVTDRVNLRPLDHYLRVEDPLSSWQVDVVRDLTSLRAKLETLAPEDLEVIDTLFRAIDVVATLHWPGDGRPHELIGIREQLHALWDMRDLAPTLIRFRGSMAHWAEAHVQSPILKELFVGLLGPDLPAIVLPFLLQQLGAGQLSRPEGGSGKLVEAITERYRALGGQLSLQTTVEEILVRDGRAHGVRLDDGTILDADHVLCTASAHETHLRLLGGRYLDHSTQHRLETWRTFDPIVLVTVAVEVDLSDLPPALVVRQERPLMVGDKANEWLMIRVYNDAPWTAPRGHTLLQTMLPTNYDFWARQGTRYADAKQELAEQVVRRFEARLPAIRGLVRMTDVSTPLTFWRWARAWHGAYEGWLPTPETFFAHVDKRVHGVERLYLAGQWVEPGGGVPPSLLSGRQAVQILTKDVGREFVTSVPRAPSKDRQEAHASARQR